MVIYIRFKCYLYVMKFLNQVLSFSYTFYLVDTVFI